jgi:hypothetical protein
MKKSAQQSIEAWLSRGYKLTPLQVLNKWGCMRLAARIAELRRGGMVITTTKVTANGKTYAQYKAA